MNKLNRKLGLILLLILVTVVGINSVVMFNRINLLSKLDQRKEATSKANQLADYLADNLPNGLMTRELEEIINLVGSGVVILSADKKVLYNNTDIKRIRDLADIDNLIAARASIENDSGQTIATLVVIDRNLMENRISQIFRFGIISSGFMGLLLIALFMLVLYALVNRPLKKIVQSMENDDLIDMTTSSDWYLVASVHNKAHQQRQRQKVSQNTFLQNASHELKSPLMNIQGYMEAMEDGLYDQSKASSLVTKECQKLKVLVDQMIRSSKADVVEEEDIHPEIIDMVSFVQDLKSIVPSKLNFIYHGDQDSLLFDRTILQVILDNLIQNACRYADSQIELIYQVNIQDIALIVKDDGAGIEPAVFNRLFERFAKGSQGKTGLGLSIVKQYVEATKGTIEAYNDGGAVFRMTWLSEKMS